MAPQKGPQTRALACPADILIFGGAAGGGKSWSLLAEPLRHVNRPGFNAVIFRRTYPQVHNPGGLWDQSVMLYSQIKGLNARPRGGLEWLFYNPGGVATIRFAHLQYEQNKLDWQGSEIALIGWDELDPL